MNKTKIESLRKRAHKLKPVVMLGQKGLSEAVVNEIDIALEAHELIKVQIGGEDKKDRRQLAETISNKTSAEHIYTVGKQAVFYKATQKINSAQK